MLASRGSAPAVVACTLLAYDERFELGQTLRQASGAVSLNHRYCAAAAQPQLSRSSAAAQPQLSRVAAHS